MSKVNSMVSKYQSTKFKMGPNVDVSPDNQ